MIKRWIIGGCLLAAAHAPAAAAADPRLVTVQFDPDRVVRIDSRTGVQSTIEFDSDEQIENVAVGDSSAWQVTPNKRANLLFVKPLSKTARTNMTVVTDRHTYLFDLVTSAAQPVYILRFRYPEKPKLRDAAPAMASIEEQAAVEQSSRAPAVPAPVNTAWRRGGNAQLLPASVHDNSSETFLSWPAGKPVPAILIRDEKGTEGPVNYAVRDGAIVVDGVPPLIILRSGREVASLQRIAAGSTTPPLSKKDLVR
jgi:type IV secretion system protein VirB9